MRLLRLNMAIGLALVISATWAQEVVIKADLDTNRALIGDQIKLRLSVEKPTDLQVGFPVMMDTITRKIEIISSSAIDTSSSAPGRNLLSRELLISVYDTGFYEVPSLAFIITSNGKYDTLNTLPVPFEIMPIKADSTIRDIKAIYKAPVSLKELSPYILLIFAIVLISCIIIRYIRRRYKRETFQPVENSLEPPEVIALRELAQLKEEKPWIHNKVKLYHIRISEILRAYIERRYKTMALEQTTYEILMSLKPPVSKASDHNLLSSVLKLADLVKFAKVIPDVNENAAQVDLATEYIRNTTDHQVTETPEDENAITMVQSNSSI